MRARVEILREAFVEWLQLREMGPDFNIYSPEEWAAREGEINYLVGAELIVVFENELFGALNYDGGGQIEDELTDLAAGFGYWYEMGHAWNLGFYPIDDWPAEPAQNATYLEKLSDERWQSKRLRILKRCGNRCEECGLAPDFLEVHHCYYRFGRQPWQYPDGALLALCPQCHEERTKAELKFRLFAPTLRTEELDIIRETLRHCQYWFNHDEYTALFKGIKSHSGGVYLPQVQLEELNTGIDMEERFRQQLGTLVDLLYQMLRGQGHPEERGADPPRNWG